MIKYDKIVRDNIIDEIHNSGRNVAYEIASGPAAVHYLIKKISEEAAELEKAQTRDEIVGEFADLYEVLDTLQTHYQIFDYEIEACRKRKAFLHGVFDKNTILIAADPKDDTVIDTEFKLDIPWH
jgi:predicted house-cleaning noncanonical NTP pyrophosphatase (MazG superfamily)